MGSNVAEENGKSYSEGEEYGHTWPCSGRERVKEQRPSSAAMWKGRGYATLPR